MSMVVPVTGFVSGSHLCQPNDESRVSSVESLSVIRPPLLSLQSLSTAAPLSRSPSLASDAELSSACDSNCVTDPLEAMLPEQAMASKEGIEAARLEQVTASKESSPGLRRIRRSYDFREFGVLDEDSIAF